MISVREILWGAFLGRQIVLLELAAPNGLCVRVSNYGALVQSLIVKDALGQSLDVVLGYDALEDYLYDPHYLGASIGPVADRVSGAACTIDGKRWHMEQNDGAHCLHSGSAGFHRQIWDYVPTSGGVRFSKHFAHGACGLPGNRLVSIEYTLCGNGLEIGFTVTTDQTTPLSPTHHGYFNLTGRAEPMAGHTLQVNAECCWLPARGQLQPVSGTLLDFVHPRTLSDRLEIDHFFVSPGSGLRRLAVLDCAANGLRMECWADAPGVLVYTGNYFNDVTGKGGRLYQKRQAICFEPQSLPDTIDDRRHRAGVLLHAGQTLRRTIRYMFLTQATNAS